VERVLRRHSGRDYRSEPGRTGVFQRRRQRRCGALVSPWPERVDGLLWTVRWRVRPR
jgi:hypothetical protein